MRNISALLSCVILFAAESASAQARGVATRNRSRGVPVRTESISLERLKNKREVDIRDDKIREERLRQEGRGTTGETSLEQAPTSHDEAFSSRIEGRLESDRTTENDAQTVGNDIDLLSIQIIDSTRYEEKDAEFISTAIETAASWGDCVPCQKGFKKTLEKAVEIAKEKNGELTAKESFVAALDQQGKRERVQRSCPTWF